MPALTASGWPPGLPAAITGGGGAAAITALIVVLAGRLWRGAAETPLGSGEILIAALIGAIYGPTAAPGVLLAGVALGGLSVLVRLVLSSG